MPKKDFVEVGKVYVLIPDAKRKDIPGKQQIKTLKISKELAESIKLE